MPNVKIFNFEGNPLGERELSDAVFAAPVHMVAMHQVVVAQLANARQGTHNAKDRSDVQGSNRKLFRQKHTGRARRGSLRSPVMVGGGVAHGPHPRDYSQKVNKKLRALAMRSVLSLKVRDDRMMLLENPVLEAPKTKAVVAFLSKVGAEKKPLLVVHETNVNLYRSAANVSGAKVLHVDSLNVYDVLNHTHLIMTPEAACKVEEVFSR